MGAKRAFMDSRSRPFPGALLTPPIPDSALPATTGLCASFRNTRVKASLILQRLHEYLSKKDGTWGLRGIATQCNRLSVRLSTLQQGK